MDFCYDIWSYLRPLPLSSLPCRLVPLTFPFLCPFPEPFCPSFSVPSHPQTPSLSFSPSAFPSLPHSKSLDVSLFALTLPGPLLPLPFPPSLTRGSSTISLLYPPLRASFSHSLAQAPSLLPPTLILPSPLPLPRSSLAFTLTPPTPSSPSPPFPRSAFTLTPAHTLTPNPALPVRRGVGYAERTGAGGRVGGRAVRAGGD